MLASEAFEMFTGIVFIQEYSAVLCFESSFML